MPWPMKFFGIRNSARKGPSWPVTPVINATRRLLDIVFRKPTMRLLYRNRAAIQAFPGAAALRSASARPPSASLRFRFGQQLIEAGIERLPPRRQPNAEPTFDRGAVEPGIRRPPRRRRIFRARDRHEPRDGSAAAGRQTRKNRGGETMPGGFALRGHIR